MRYFYILLSKKTTFCIKGSLKFNPGFVIIFFGSPNCKTIAWFTSLTINIEKNATTAITPTKGNIIFNKSINVHTVESSISRELKNIQKKYIDKVEIGSYPFFRLGKIGVSIVLRSSNQKKLKLCLFEIKKMIKIKKIKIYKY